MTPLDDLDDGGELFDPATDRVLMDVSWAVAARDTALQAGDADAAARFAHEARQAMTDADRAGLTVADLAAELDYPGGAAALDGPHIDRHLADLAPAEQDPAAAVDDAHQAVMHLVRSGPARSQEAEWGGAYPNCLHDDRDQADDDGEEWTR